MRKAMFAAVFALLGMAPAVMAAQNESLLIGPGDLLHVQVFDTPEMDQHPRVDDAGNASLLFIGKVPLLGRTPAEAAERIRETLVAKQMMRRPEVSVTVEHYATQEVSVLGQVNKPGSYAIGTPRSILDVLSLAGGLAPAADRHLLIRHHDTALGQESYFAANDVQAATGHEVRVYPGDTVLVPKVGLVYVLGDVARPGGYPMSGNDTPATLLQTLAEAGSPNRSAAVSASKLIRRKGGGYSEVPLNLAAIEKGKAPDMVVEADDVIFVPFSYARNFALNSTSVAASVASAAIYVR